MTLTRLGRVYAGSVLSSVDLENAAADAEIAAHLAALKGPRNSVGPDFEFALKEENLMSYAHTVTLATPFEEAVTLVREALAAQGFGVLTEIDIRATFAAKLGPDAATEVGDYLILGACNPRLAHRAVTTDPAIGVLLPCNVVVRRSPGAGETVIQAIDPATMTELSDQPGINDVADEADGLLRAALSSLGSGGPK